MAYDPIARAPDFRISELTSRFRHIRLRLSAKACDVLWPKPPGTPFQCPASPDIPPLQPPAQAFPRLEPHPRATTAQSNTVFVVGFATTKTISSFCCAIGLTEFHSFLTASGYFGLRGVRPVPCRASSSTMAVHPLVGTVPSRGPPRAEAFRRCSTTAFLLKVRPATPGCGRKSPRPPNSESVATPCSGSGASQTLA